MIQLSNVGKRYGDHVVLDQVSFVLNVGDRLGLIGPNGCGKTTLLRIAAGLESADQGSVRRSSPDLRVGYLEQGLSHREGDTLADLLRLREAELEQAEAQVARSGEALAAADENRQTALLDAYSRAVAALERAPPAEPPPLTQEPC